MGLDSPGSDPTLACVAMEIAHKAQCCHSKKSKTLDGPLRKPQVKFVQILRKNRTFPGKKSNFSWKNRTFSEKSGFLSKKFLMTFFLVMNSDFQIFKKHCKICIFLTKPQKNPRFFEKPQEKPQNPRSLRK